MRRLEVALVVGLVGLTGCAGPDDGTEAAMERPEEIVLGPAEGHDLPGVDLDRVQVGQSAPDFTLTSLAGPPVRLSSFRGTKNVVLVFYRGHW